MTCVPQDFDTSLFTFYLHFKSAFHLPAHFSLNLIQLKPTAVYWVPLTCQEGEEFFFAFQLCSPLFLFGGVAINKLHFKKSVLGFQKSWSKVQSFHISPWPAPHNFPYYLHLLLVCYICYINEPTSIHC